VSTPLATIVYGVLYPVTPDVANTVIAEIESLEFNTHTRWVEITTTDGRTVILRVGPSQPIALRPATETE
jgi:hypothetical protein